MNEIYKTNMQLAPSVRRIRKQQLKIRIYRALFFAFFYWIFCYPINLSLIWLFVSISKKKKKMLSYCINCKSCEIAPKRSIWWWSFEFAHQHTRIDINVIDVRNSNFQCQVRIMFLWYAWMFSFVFCFVFFCWLSS